MIKVIPNATSYGIVWYNGCGPSAATPFARQAFELGFDNILNGPGYNNALLACASPEHVTDYAYPKDSTSTGLLQDKSTTGGAHEDNCLADFFHTSQSKYGNYYGWSWGIHADDCLDNYFALRGYPDAVALYVSFYNLQWEHVKKELDNDRMLLLLVDSNADGYTDHFITMVGYNDDDPNDIRYCALNNWDLNLHWYPWVKCTKGIGWGVSSATFLDMGPMPTTITIPSSGSFLLGAK